MDWKELIQEAFLVCIIPLLGVLTRYVIAFLQIKSEEIQSKQDNELAKKYTQMLTDTIRACVVATNQTYTESLKNQNAFDVNAQKQAFELTYNAVLTILGEDAKVYLSSAYGDLQEYITKQIEKEVNYNK